MGTNKFKIYKYTYVRQSHCFVSEKQLTALETFKIRLPDAIMVTNKPPAAVDVSQACRSM